MTDRAAHIGVFDSGVGGLSIFASTAARLPGARFFYCSDNANFPYGVRTEDDVVACTHGATSRFIARCGLDLLIIACNTASTVALPHLRASFQVPVVGVVPAIKPAAALSRTRTIALLATPGTVKRPYTDELIARHAADCLVIKTGSSALVHLAERKLRGEALPIAELQAELAPLFAASPVEAERRVDAVVLGCTHFPLLEAELTAAAPWPVRWVDSSEAVAARTEFLLQERGIDARVRRADVPAPEVYFTKDDTAARELAPALRRLGFGAVETLK